MSLQKKIITDLWWAGVNAVRGDVAVHTTCQTESISSPNLIIAVGKAASGMTNGALSYFDSNIDCIVITKEGHGDPALRDIDSVRIIESSHPIPDSRSLEAGDAVLEAIRDSSPDSRILFLISGGTSSLAEVPVEGFSLENLIALNENLTTSGLTIEQINEERKRHSCIKAGKLLSNFKGKSVDVIYINDTEQADIATVGSGLADVSMCDQSVTANVYCAASNAIARDAVVRQAETYQLVVRHNDESLYEAVPTLAERLAKIWREGPSGIYVHGGESTVTLPSNPGVGGRNQHLGLLLAQEISGTDCLDVIVAGTDGSDGPTTNAGAIICGQTWQNSKDPVVYLNHADSGTYLEKTDALFISGPTETNVMDLVIALKK